MKSARKLYSLGGYVSAVLLAATLGASAANAQVVPQAGWWHNPNEPGGRGLVIGNNSTGGIFASTLLFDSSGRAEWFALDTTAASDGNQAGQLQKFVGGQATNGRYRTGTFLGFVGVAHLVFQTPTEGTMSWPGGNNMSIARYNIVPDGVASGPAAGSPAGGWWWNASESGSGYFLEIQGDNMFFAGLLYNDLGQSTWYFARGAMTTPTLFTGQLNEAFGGQTMQSENYQPATQNYNRGNITIQFSSTTAATITMPDGVGTAITRYGS
jgi:hypothetical protein